MNPGYDRWNLLVESLAEIGDVAERDPYGLVVTRQRDAGTTLVVEIVMTPRDWEDLVDIVWGAVESATRHVRALVLAQPGNQRYLVYSNYELGPCETPTLPIDPGMLRLQQMAAKYPDGVIPGGRWVAYPPEDDAH